MIGQAYISHEGKIVIFWSPKCASTAISQWFIHNFVDTEKYDGKFTRRMLASNGFACSAKTGQHLVLKSNYKSIFFSRNPFRRCVSTYLNKFYVKHKRPLLQYKDLEPFARAFIDQVNQHNGKPPKHFEITFIEYLKFVFIFMNEGRLVDRHWATQVPTQFGFEVVPDFIVKQECFSEELRLLNRQMGLPDFIPEFHNITSYDDSFKADSLDYSEKSNIFCLDRSIALSYRNLLNPTSARLMLEIYKVDFEYFGYDPTFL